MPSKPITRYVIEPVILRFPEGGTILEFGVAAGSSYIQLANIIRNHNWSCKLIGFDSWQGLPKETEGLYRSPGWIEGRFSYPRKIVENKLRKLGVSLPNERFMLVDGWFEDTLTVERQQTIENLIFVNVDSDLYSSAVTVLEFLTPLLQKGTIIYFDDWYGNSDEICGERLAFKQWMERHPEISYELIYIRKDKMSAAIEIL